MHNLPFQFFYNNELASSFHEKILQQSYQLYKKIYIKPRNKFQYIIEKNHAIELFPESQKNVNMNM